MYGSVPPYAFSSQDSTVFMVLRLEGSSWLVVPRLATLISNIQTCLLLRIHRKFRNFHSLYICSNINPLWKFHNLHSQ
jgi:hypothetical protein